jgi:hypothetical protein
MLLRGLDLLLLDQKRSENYILLLVDHSQEQTQEEKKTLIQNKQNKKYNHKKTEATEVEEMIGIGQR